jgi:hypothetical protein
LHNRAVNALLVSVCYPRASLRGIYKGRLIVEEAHSDGRYSHCRPIACRTFAPGDPPSGG